VSGEGVELDEEDKHNAKMAAKVMDLEEQLTNVQRHMDVQRSIHATHRRGCVSRMNALRDLYVRVEKQRDEAWERIEELEEQVRRLSEAKKDEEPEYVFEAHRDGTSCGRPSCLTCNGSLGAFTG
jgi:hypothetical protein